MMLILTLMILWGAGPSTTWAQTTDSQCGEMTREVESQDIECLLRELVKTEFPELTAALNEERITIQKFRSESSFVRTKIRSGLTRSQDNREYAIEVNPAMYRTFLPVLPRPSLKAVQGILARELVRVAEYEKATALGLAKQRLIDSSAEERNVDERAFERGFAEGIALFRVWAESRLCETEALDRKKDRVYTPEEIHDWIMENELARPKH